MSLHGCYQVMQHRPLLQAQRLHHGQHTFHETAAVPTPTPISALPPQDTPTNHPLRVIVRRFDAFRIQKRPQGRLHGQQILTQRHHLGIAARKAILQLPTELRTHRLQLAHPFRPTDRPTAIRLPPMKQQVSRRPTDLAQPLAGRAAPLGHPLKIPAQMRPANLPLANRQAAIGRPAIRTDDALHHVSQQAAWLTVPQPGQMRVCPWCSTTRAAKGGNSATWCQVGSGSFGPAWTGSGCRQAQQWRGR